MQFTRKKMLIVSILSFVIVFNLFLGLPRLSRFSAVDEPYWTYGRISKFWKAVAAEKWSSTNVNDKPGITVAILSGTGLLKYDPLQYKSLREQPKTASQLDDFRSINFYFRLPIFLFCTLMLLAFFFLLNKLFGKTVALLGFILIGLSPILFGISLIINPDSLLWIFLPLSLLSYFVFQKEEKKSYLVASGILLGLALLTKYVANILYIFFFLLPFLEYIFMENKPDLTAYLKKSSVNYLVLVLISMATFYVLYPATWAHPQVLLDGTFLSKAFKTTWPLFAGLIALIGADILLFKSKVTNWVMDFVSKNKSLLVQLTTGMFLLIIAFVFIDTYLGMKTFDLEGILSSPKGIGAKNIFDSYAGAILADTYSLIFGMHPLAFAALLAALVFNLKKKTAYTREALTVFYFTIFILFYYLASSVNDVAATVRYQITLYPLALMISAIGMSYVISLKHVRKYISKKLSWVLVLLVVAPSLFFVRPFYFTYASALLPQKYLLNTKDMGDGSYEAANFLNQLPNAGSLIVWSDKGAVCESFVGDCLTGYAGKELRAIHFDYFVASAGRKSKSIKISTTFKNNLNFKNLYDPNSPAAFKLIIGNRTDNFIKVSEGNSVYDDNK
jgi:4-amino-4-deoxy-L-arabinose transferase-like glycosyltransferase